MNHYSQLTLGQRYQIQAYMKASFNQTQTADFIGVDKSTVSRELRHNRGQRGYRAPQAHRFSLQRRADKATSRIDNATWRHVRQLLRQNWSPEQVSHWLSETAVQSLSHEAIYQYVLSDKQAGGSLYRHLRCRKQRKKRYGAYSRRGQIPNQVSIDQRSPLSNPDVVSAIGSSIPSSVKTIVRIWRCWLNANRACRCFQGSAEDGRCCY